MVDIRRVDHFPEAETIEGIKVLSPIELIVSNVISYHSRLGNPESGTDWRDIGYLLLRFPELKSRVTDVFTERNSDEAVMGTWFEIAAQDFTSDEDDGGNLVF